ncbi:MAG TPA: hypothetical protein VHX65_19790 [Pirellulales bacterium]|jgi:hypothetical protein|nr:hypothetical protein [Pirellulales bacterium]
MALSHRLSSIYRWRPLGIGKRYWVALFVVLAVGGGTNWLRAWGHREWQRETDSLATFRDRDISFTRSQVLPAWFFGQDGERVVEVSCDAGPRLVPGAAILDRDTIWVGTELEGWAMHRVNSEPPLAELRRAKGEFPYLKHIKIVKDWRVDELPVEQLQQFQAAQ